MPGPRRPVPLLVATGLVAALAAGPVTPGTALLGGSLVALAVAGLAAPRPGPAPPAWVDPALVAALTLGFAAAALRLDVDAQPIGTDWQAYLRNAVAAGTGDWSRYQDWRGPLHAWASLAVLPLTRDLVAATQLLALVCTTSLVPLAWGLGRAHGGRLAGLLAAGLVAGAPDLLVYARTSTPYPLLAALLAGGACAVTAGGRAGALAGGVLLGLAAVTDLRGGPLGAAVLGGAALLPGGWRRAVAAAAVAATVAAGLYAALPVRLTPLSEQVALQRSLHAAEGETACLPGPQLLPGPADLAGPCARRTLAGNLARAAAASPVPPAWFGALAVAGAALGPGPLGARALLLLPLLVTLPGAALIGMQHRYLLPLAAFGAALGGRALAALVPEGSGRRAPAALAAVVVVAVGAAQHAGSATLLARATGRGRPVAAAPAVVLGAPKPLTDVHRRLVAEARPGETIVDCTQAGLRLRLHPRDVEETRAPGRCRALLARAPARTWLLVESADAPGEGWTVAGAWPRGPATLYLLHAAPR